MKKLAEKLLALGILTLGLCVLTGCPGNAGPNTPKDKPGTEIDTDTDTETQHKLHRMLRPHISKSGSQTVLLQQIQLLKA